MAVFSNLRKELYIKNSGPEINTFEERREDPVIEVVQPKEILGSLFTGVVFDIDARDEAVRIKLTEQNNFC
ncbi:hypothetical protein HYW35_00330 [Candidatus Saccharibacteria bacterium]|nr:hypothetical protein [Candidatus Saccharibacteria bacterium]